MFAPAYVRGRPLAAAEPVAPAPPPPETSDGPLSIHDLDLEWFFDDSNRTFPSNSPRKKSVTSREQWNWATRRVAESIGAKSNDDARRLPGSRRATRVVVTSPRPFDRETRTEIRRSRDRRQRPIQPEQDVGLLTVLAEVLSSCAATYHIDAKNG